MFSALITAEITDPIPNFNGATVEVWKWISYFKFYFVTGVITYPCWWRKKRIRGHKTLQLLKQFACSYVSSKLKWYPWHNFTLWRHRMGTFSALLAICAGNSPVPGEFPTQRPVTRSFDVYFDLCPNERLSKHSWGWWLEMPPRPLWCHRNERRFS